MNYLLFVHKNMKAQSSLGTGPGCHSHCAASGHVCSESIVLVLHLFCFEWQDLTLQARLLRRLLYQLGSANGRNGCETGWREEEGRPCSQPQVASPAGVVSFPLLDRPILVPAEAG